MYAFRDATVESGTVLSGLTRMVAGATLVAIVAMAGPGTASAQQRTVPPPISFTGTGAPLIGATGTPAAVTISTAGVSFTGTGAPLIGATGTPAAVTVSTAGVSFTGTGAPLIGATGMP